MISTAVRNLSGLFLQWLFVGLMGLCQIKLASWCDCTHWLQSLFVCLQEVNKHKSVWHFSFSFTSLCHLPVSGFLFRSFSSTATLPLNPLWAETVCHTSQKTNYRNSSGSLPQQKLNKSYEEHTVFLFHLICTCMFFWLSKNHCVPMSTS